MAGHGYMINEFLAQRTNQRTDQWGGTLENRARLLFRITEEVRKTVFFENVKKIKPRLSIPVILVGGLRSPSIMSEIVEGNQADMIAIGRPLIREPDFPNKILNDRSYVPSCINCNRCFIRISQARALGCYQTRPS